VAGKVKGAAGLLMADILWEWITIILFQIPI